MSRSPPPSSWYPPQGPGSGPPPMPSKPSDRRSPGPGYDRAPPADWYKWQEYFRTHSPRTSPGRVPPRTHSPNRSGSPRGDPSGRAPSPHERVSSRRSPSPRKERQASPRSDRLVQRPRSPRSDNRPPSPRRERPRSPVWEWRRRSPPPLPYHHPPPQWRKRSRSPPPHWIRRSPPRYNVPRGRSPPRGAWGPPPPEWDRYRGPPPMGRYSPSRWGPPPPRPWDHRREPPSGPPYRRGSPARPLPSAPSAPPPDFYKNESGNNKGVLTKGVDGVLPPGDEKDEVIDNFDLPEYNPDIPLGQKYVIAVSGFFCKVCHKFYNSEASAKITHCKSRAHYDKFSKWLSEKQVAALMKKREASAKEADEQDEKESEPPAKQIKLEIPEVKEEPKPVPPPASDGTYDPSQPTEDDTPDKPGVKDAENTDESAMDTSVEPSNLNETGVSEQNGQGADSDSEALITNETKKDDDGFVEATLYNLRKMRVNQLKANLEKRGLKSTGLKTLLLKRLEKVLLEEAAAANEAEQDESTEKQQAAIVDDGGAEANPDGTKNKMDETRYSEYVLNLHESDIELSNRKTQWITERELVREMEQIEGVISVEKVTSVKSKIGRKMVVEWMMTVKYDGNLPEDGLFFLMPSHQQLPFKAELAEPEDE